MKMSIKSAKTSDLKLLARMNLRLIRDEKHRNPMGVPALQRRMARWLKGEYRATLFQACEITVGYCLFKREPGYWYLRHFFIDRPFRRMGWGRTAFSLMRRKVWKKPGRVRVEVLTANRRGRLFWKSLGFSEYCLTLER